MRNRPEKLLIFIGSFFILTKQKHFSNVKKTYGGYNIAVQKSKLAKRRGACNKTKEAVHSEMERQTVFSYQYSAAQNKEVEAIRQKYLPMEENKMERLRRLDRRVQSAGVVPSLCVGIIGSLIFGIGMCFGPEVFAGADWASVAFCAVGLTVLLPAYPIYRRLSRRTKEKMTSEILRLSDEILK